MVVFKDSEAVDWLASRLEEWATAISQGRPIFALDEGGILVQLLTDGGPDKQEPIVLDMPGANKPRSVCRPFHSLVGTVTGETFSAEVRIVPNFDPKSPYCIEVRFNHARAPQQPHKGDESTKSSESVDHPRILLVSTAERCIYLRVGHDGSGVDNRDVRSFRRALGGYLDPACLDAPKLNLTHEADGPEVTWQLETVPRSRSIYWNEECPSADLRAQLLIALAQLIVVPVDASLTRELERYLLRNFGTSIKWAVKRHRLMGEQVAERACAHILQNYSFPEHPHGFRLYVKLAIRWAPGPSEVEYQPVYDTAKESYTVPEAAFHLEVSKDVVYWLIRQERIHVQRDDAGLIRIPRGEFLKVAAYRLERLRRKRERKELQNQHGKSYEAARKAVYRMKGRIPRIGG